MSKFESTLGDKKFTGPNLREFDIPDGEEMEQVAGPSSIKRNGLPQVNSDSIRDFQNRVEMQERDPSDIEREFQAARQAKRTGKERLNDGARRRIEMLVGMTRSTREVDIEGNQFVLQVLRSKEMREAIMAAAEFDNTVQSPFEVRRQFLARSLIVVAGLDIEQFVGSIEFNAKLELIDSLPEPLLSRLYDEYVELLKTARDKFSVKDTETAKEVIEDLKK
jgi:hypothetical protein